MFCFGFSTTKRRSSGGGVVSSPVLSSVAVTYAGASDTSFHITGGSTNSGGTAYGYFVTKGAGATAAATIKASANWSQALSGTSFDGTATRSAPNIMGVQDCDVVVEDGNGFSNVVRLVVYNYSAKLWSDAGTFSDAVKAIQNTYVINLKYGLTNNTDVWAKMVELKREIFADATNNAINIKNPGTFNSTYINSPSHGAGGVAYNGTTQYCTRGVVPSTDLTLNDSHQGATKLTDLGTSNAFCGSSNGTNYMLIYESTTSVRSMNYTGADQMVAAGVTANGSFIQTRRSSTDRQFFKNGASIGTSVVGGGALPAFELYGAAYNLSGVASLLCADTFRGFSSGLGITANEAADLQAADEALYTAMGL